MPLVIDCYNLMHAEKPQRLAGLDEVGLCRLLDRSGWAGGGITLVCDGVVKPHGPAESPVGSVQIVYSGPGCTADDVIIRMIHEDSAPRRLVVVSDDRQIQKAARRRRCRVLGNGQFVRMLAGSASRPGRGGGGRGRTGRRTEPLTEREVDDWLRLFDVHGEDARRLNRVSRRWRRDG